MNYVKKEESPIIPLKSKRSSVINFQKSTTNHDELVKSHQMGRHSKKLQMQGAQTGNPP